jgi:exodeoxyribonuclease VII large subunit
MPKESLLSQKIYTPTQVANLIQEDLDRYHSRILVEGEIASVAKPYSGHTYFQLKDKKSILKAMIWKNRLPFVGCPVEDGLSVKASGSLAVYGPRSEYQLTVESLEPLGDGALRRAFEELKNKLSLEGLFDDQRKRPLPFWPKRVALVTSAVGAAFKDFITTSIKRCPSAKISLYPVRVQGSLAAEEIAMALHDLNQWQGFDVIVLTRGGGSLEDLLAFNQEVLIRAVVSSRIPILAAIGHSTDLSLCEMASDQKAITPTAAAETIFPDQSLILKSTKTSLGRIYRATFTLMEKKRQKLLSYTEKVVHFQNRILQYAQLLDQFNEKLSKAVIYHYNHHKDRLKSLTHELNLSSPKEKLKRNQKELFNSIKTMKINITRQINNHHKHLNQLKDSLRLVSPLNILQRGYALVSYQGHILKSASDVQSDEILDIRLSRGALKVRVLEQDDHKTGVNPLRRKNN